MRGRIASFAVGGAVAKRCTASAMEEKPRCNNKHNNKHNNHNEKSNN